VGPQILGAIVENLFARSTYRLEFLHPWFILNLRCRLHTLGMWKMLVLTEVTYVLIRKSMMVLILLRNLHTF